MTEHKRYIMTEEHKAKIREAKRNKPMTERHKAAIRAANARRAHDPEVKAQFVERMRAARERAMAAGEGWGFARLPDAHQRQIASLGGKAAHAKGTGHEFTSDEAREAGRKGGKAKGKKYGAARHDG